jgi:uncharacterized protein YcbK (DUF882 family)
MDRRAFIGAAGWIVAPWSAWAAYRPPPPATRRLKLFNAHTGESFDGLYRDEHGPSTSAAAELAELLRDHHSGTIAPIDLDVIDFLWDVLNTIGATAATILSAYRTPETNAMLHRTTFGVAEHSQHIYGRAIDFYVASGLAEAVSAARSMRRGGVGWYPQSHFIHIDTGPVRNWTLGESDLRDLLIAPDDARAATAAHIRSGIAPRLRAGYALRGELILRSR